MDIEQCNKRLEKVVICWCPPYVTGRGWGIYSLNCCFASCFCTQEGKEMLQCGGGQFFRDVHVSQVLIGGVG